MDEEFLKIPYLVCLQLESEQKRFFYDELKKLHKDGIISDDKMIEISKEAWSILYFHCPHLPPLAE